MQHKTRLNNGSSLVLLLYSILLPTILSWFSWLDFLDYKGKNSVVKSTDFEKPHLSADISSDRCGFQTLLCASVCALGEDCEAIIIVANYSRICWACEHIGQSAMFKNWLNSAQMLEVFKIPVPTGTNTMSNRSDDCSEKVVLPEHSGGALVWSSCCWASASPSVDVASGSGWPGSDCSGSVWPEGPWAHQVLQPHNGTGV